VPAISVKSGKPCDNPVAISLRPGSRPWAPGGRRVIAIVPLEPSRVFEHLFFARANWVILGALIVSLLSISFVGAGLVEAFFVLYVAIVVVGDARWIGARRAGNDAVELTRVHRAFAAAVNR
jgi:hypothetical protein